MSSKISELPAAATLDGTEKIPAVQAGGNVYINPHSGLFEAWVPTFTGFSADPTVTNSGAFVLGKLCIAYWTTGAGTSNATTLTMTLPYAAKNACVFVLEIMDNNIVDTGRAAMAAGSNVLSVLKANLGAFTASGNKLVRGFIAYEIQ